MAVVKPGGGGKSANRDRLNRGHRTRAAAACWAAVV